jgi:hypothetical protein
MEMFSLEWREHRVRIGDKNLDLVEKLLKQYASTTVQGGPNEFIELQAVHIQAQTLIAAAAANYAAANVRVSEPRKPAPVPDWGPDD